MRFERAVRKRGALTLTESASEGERAFYLSVASR